jgi:hypothetical protein
MNAQVINAYLRSRKHGALEGNTGLCQAKLNLLARLSASATNALEIGYNAGHSADCLLSANPLLKLTSCDLGEHPYVFDAQRLTAFLHPGRHTLILGDSTKVLPEHTPEKPYDLIFIDGGHAYDVAHSDMVHALRLAAPGACIIMDDTIYVPGWEKDYSKGPTKVWLESIEAGLIENCVNLTFDEYNGISYGYTKSDSSSTAEQLDNQRVAFPGIHG